jgi:hypothetical protein
MPPLLAQDDVDKVLQYESELRSLKPVAPFMKFDVAAYWQPFLGTLLFHRFRKTSDTKGMSAVLSRFEGSWCYPLLTILA